MSDSTTLKDFLGAGQNDFDKLFDSLGNGQVQELAKEADWMAQRAAFVAAYLEDRGANGCGDNGHESATNAGEKRVKAARKALGFLIP